MNDVIITMLIISATLILSAIGYIIELKEELK